MKRFAFFELIVAYRFMREGLMQTLLIIFGVALGGGVIIFMSAVLSGLQSNVVRRTLNFQAPIVILPTDQVARPLRAEPRAEIAARVQPRSQQLRSIDQWQKVREQVAQTPGVTALTPVVSGPGFALRGDANKAVTITGIEPETYYDVIALPEKIIAGRQHVGPLDIIIGTELSADLGAGVGDKVRLTTATGATATLSVTGSASSSAPPKADTWARLASSRVVVVTAVARLVSGSRTAKSSSLSRATSSGGETVSASVVATERSRRSPIDWP